MSRMVNLTADVYRSPPPVDGKRGPPALHLSAVRCTPLDPISGELRLRLGLHLQPELKAPTQLLQTLVLPAVDLRAGDWLEVAGRRYPVRAAAVWQGRAGGVLHVILEDLVGQSA